MKPILYAGTETAFTSYGLGTLDEAISCLVTEERNGKYELKMAYPVSGRLFSDLAVNEYVLAKPNETSDPQPFRIYRITTPMNGAVTVYGEHISYRLSGIPVKPFTASGIQLALNGLVTNSMVDCPFTVWTDVSTGTAEYVQTQPKSFRACLGGTEGSILDTYSGAGGLEYEFDLFAVKLYANRGSDTGVTIEYGKNLTSVKQEQNIAATYTGCLAYWTSTDGETTVTGEVQYVDNHAEYPAERIYIYDASGDYDEQPSVSDLNTRAAAYRDDNDIGTPKVSLTVSFVQLADTEEYKSIAPLERVRLCDTVTVYFPKLSIDAKAKVIKTVYDSILEKYDSIELGDARSSFADTIRQAVSGDIASSAASSEKRTSSALENAVQSATDKITGGTGGHFIIGTNASGQPNETFWMDTDDKSTATKVLRANYQGIGGSSTGINGPYNVAITTDGQINASAITTGELNADLIMAGTISDATGNSYWNVETGELKISTSAAVGDTTVGGISDQANDAYSLANQTAEDSAAGIAGVSEVVQKNSADIESLNDSVTSLSDELTNTQEELDSVSGTIGAAVQEAEDYSDSQLEAYKTEIGQYMQYSTDTGLTLGAAGSSFKQVLTNDRQSFVQDGQVVAYFQAYELNVESLVAKSRFRIGNFYFTPRSDGSVSVVWHA